MRWPKLSETLPGRSPDRCQRCDAVGTLTRWNECDEDDNPAASFVVLCQPCADAIIDPHPRLYKWMTPNTPAPGAMAICLDCPSRDGLRCTSPVAGFNGGPGLKYEPEGGMVHVCRSPRSQSGWHYMASGPVTKCSGKEAAQAASL